MLKHWLKPRWEHPDPLVRLEAVGELAMEQAVLQRLAKDDPSVDVRRAAIRRLDDMRVLVGLCAVTSEVSRAARVRLQILLRSRPEDGAADPALLAEAITVCDDPLLTQMLARESPSPQMRRAALELIHDEAALARIAAEDAIPEIRLAAFERVRSEEALKTLERAVRGRDKRVAQSARQRLALIQERRERDAECERIIAELQQRGGGDDWSSDEAAWPRLRERWRSLEPDLDPGQRERCAEAAEAFEGRLEAYREERRHEAEIRVHREGLCTALERLLADDADDTLERRLAEIESAWRVLRGPEGPSVRLKDTDERFAELIDRARGAVNQRRARAALDSTLRGLEGEAESLKQLDRLDPARVDALAREVEALTSGLPPALAPRHSALKDRVSALGERLARQGRADPERVDALERELADLDRALAENRLEAALHSHRQATELLRDLTGLPGGRRRRIEGRLRAAGPRLGELKSWRHWGSDRAREALIERAEALPEAAMPPEKLAAEVRELRREWKRLGRIDAGGKGLWRRFDAACTRAYQPVVEHRREAAAARERNLEERAGICVELERIEQDTDWDRPDWRAVDKAVHRLCGQWRNAGPVARTDWEVVRTRYGEAVAALEAHLDKERRHNRLQREALIQEAEALARQDNARAAAESARRIRDAWQVTVSSPPGEERALWQRLRGALDDAFERERAGRDEHRRSLDANLSRAQELCADLEQLATADPSDVLSRQSEADRLAAEFGALGNLPVKRRRAVEERFDRARRAFRGRVAEALEAREDRELENTAAWTAVCERLEQAVLEGRADADLLQRLQTEWDSLPDLEDGAAAERLGRRFASAMEAAADEGARSGLAEAAARNLEHRRALCLDLEILLGAESPADEREARLAHQVEMLARSLKEGRSGSRETRVQELKRECLLTGPVPPDAVGPLNQRLEALMDRRGPSG